jgi:phage protein D
MTRKQLIDVLVYSPDYVLMDHPHCRSYTNQTLSDIVFSIFEDCPSSLVVSQHYEGMIPYTVQYNETNYQFLVRLAQRYGQWMCYDGDCFRFVHRLDDMKTLELYPKMDIQNYRY